MHQIFETKHIILLIISLILIPILYFISRKITFTKMTKIMLFLGILSEIVKIFYYIITNEDTHGGVLPKTDLPFHLCSIQIIFILILNISKNEKLKKLIISFIMPSCLIGGLAALLLPTTSALNGLFILTAQYFLYHIAIMVYALFLMTSEEYNPSFGGYIDCLKMLLIIMFFAIYINSVLYDGESNINFMYVVGPPMDGLPYLNKNGGWLSYIIKYVVLVLSSVTLFYIKPIFIAAKNKFKH